MMNKEVQEFLLSIGAYKTGWREASKTWEIWLPSYVTAQFQVEDTIPATVSNLLSAVIDKGKDMGRSGCQKELRELLGINSNDD